jgi:RNA polymerase sigma factor (sigma-70 family)
MNAPLAQLARLVGDLAREPDGRLLDAFLAGSQPAFRELVTRHGSLVFAVCNRVLRHRQDAEDAFQAVFLVLARRAADVWPRDAVGSWLYGVAYRVALKARSLRTRRQGRERSLEDVPRNPPTGPEPDAAEVIDRVVRRLPEMYRAAVVACDLEGLSRRDAAARLGWKEGTLSGRLARARQLLADRLRKAGLSLPAAGLAATLGTQSPVRAALAESVIDVATGNAAAGVPAPVAALTEGVVPSMFAFKLKALAAAVVMACGLGYGAWAAGPGDGPGAPGGSGASATQPLPAPEKKEQPRPQPVSPAKVSPELQPLQGRWRVSSIVSEGKESVITEKHEYPDAEISGNVLSMPYRDASAGWRQEKTTIAVDNTQRPKTIDLISSGKPVGRGIYEIVAPAQTCQSCHTTEGLGFVPSKLTPMPLCPPGLKAAPRPADVVELRLAIATSGPRPTKFGSNAAGVVEFTLRRVGAEPWDERAQLELERAELEAWLRANERAPGREAERDSVTAKLRVLEAKNREKEARARLEKARAVAVAAQAEADVAEVHLQIAVQQLKDAQERLKAAEKDAARLGDPKKPTTPAKEGEAFTVHIRTLLAAEKVIRVKATGKETVLEGLAYAAEDMAIKPEALSVWVVRDKEVMPIDLAGITQWGDTKTNYVLKPGDQLFVQARVGK